MNRVPALIIVVALIAGLVAADRFVAPRVAEGAAPELLPMPAISSEDTLGSTWYCPANLVSAGGEYESVLVVTNPGPAVSGTLTVFPGPVGTGERSPSSPSFVDEIDLDESSQVRISLSDQVRSGVPAFANGETMFAGAVLEFSTPGVLVEHVVTTPFGADMAPCDSQSSTEWYSASSTTINEVSSYLLILNPFPAPSVVDLTFSSDDGETFEDGLVVAPRSQLLVNLSEVNRVRAQAAITVSARSGRVVAEKIQLFNRLNSTRGTTLSSGAGELSTQWFFPSGHTSLAGESYLIYNPADEAAEVELLVKPVDIPGLDVQPLSIDFDVAAGERKEVVLADSDLLPSSDRALRYGSRIDNSLDYWVLVQSFNDVPLVVERVRAIGEDDRSGVSVGPGVAVSSTVQWLSFPIELGAAAPQVSIVNPANDTLARVEVRAMVENEIVEVTDLEIAPGDRVTADLAATLPIGALALLLESSAPIATEVTVAAPTAAVSTPAIPVENTISPTRLVVDY